jgi:UDP-glucose 4-epimerase
VIGGNGFVGSHLVDELARLGHEVTVFDRFSAGVIYSAPGVRPIAGDFMNHAHLRGALAGQEYVFHFLSTTTPATAEDDPTLDVRTNIASSIDLFQLCVEAGVARVYFASTGGAIYGDQPPGLITEHALPLPISPYAIGKLAIEGYLRYFRRKHGLQSVTFRISNPYGPRQRANKKQGVIPIFLHSVAEGLPLSQYGDGSMVRDFLYVEDAAKLMAAVVEHDPEHSVYNIGSGQGHSLAEVIDIVKDVTGRDVAVERKPQPLTYVDRVVLDTSRYRAEFGTPDFVSLAEGVRRTWLDVLADEP